MSSADVADLTGARRWLNGRNSLAWRLGAWFGAGALVVIVAAAIMLSVALEAQTRWIDDQILSRRAVELSGILTDADTFHFWSGHEVSEDMDGPRRILVRLIGENGAVLAETPGMDAVLPASRFPVVIQSPLGRERRGDASGSDGGSYRVVTARYPSTAGVAGAFATVQIAADTRLDAVVLGRYRLAALVAAALISLACLALCAVAVRAALRPIERFARAVDTVSSKTLSHRIPLAHLPDELEQLGRHFNAMLARLEESYSDLKHYADNVAHEVRTPLNAILLNAEVSLMTETSTEGYRNSLEKIVEDCGTLVTLTGRLLFLARADGGAERPVAETVPVREEIERVVRYFEGSAEEAGICLSVAVPEGHRIWADRVLLQRAVSNLVSNAIAHTREGGKISISTAVAPEGDEIIVADTGVGMPSDDIARVFDRFYRGEDAHAGEDPRSARVGLGLAITKAIMDLHGGSVRIESVPGRGTKVALVFPAGGATST
ncbi:MAG: heavy metal sensor histidine kinase [Hyphomonadaceae bacterium]|nr:heavy metal sensor histidine kinase [Hyphomonadaceae bacterium]